MQNASSIVRFKLRSGRRAVEKWLSRQVEVRLGLKEASVKGMR